MIRQGALAFAMLVALGASVRADDDPRLYATLVPRPSSAPRVRIVVHGAPAPRAVTVRHRGAVIPASELRPYAQLDEPAAIVLVVSGLEIWMGNDQIEPALDSQRRPNPAYLPGALGALGDGLAAAQLSMQFPRDSAGALVTYADRALLRAPMQPLAKLGRAALGTQRDYYTKIGSQLVDGIERGIDELARSGKQRRILIVVGDGTDTDFDAAPARLAALKQRAARDLVETHAIVWKAPLSNVEDVIGRFTPHVTRVRAADDLATALPRLVTSLGDRYQLEIPSETLPRDERITLVVHDGTREVGSVELVLPGAALAAATAAAPRRSWWPFALGAAGLVGLALGVHALRRTSQRAPLD